MIHQTETPKDNKATANARVLAKDLPRLATLGEKCERIFGGSFPYQHTISKALDYLDRGLEAAEKGQG